MDSRLGCCWNTRAKATYQRHAVEAGGQGYYHLRGQVPQHSGHLHLRSCSFTHEVTTECGEDDGGKQPFLRDTMWNGRVQKMVTEDGVQKGLRTVLQERGVDTKGMNSDNLKTVLGEYEVN